MVMLEYTTPEKPLDQQHVDISDYREVLSLPLIEFTSKTFRGAAIEFLGWLIKNEDIKNPIPYDIICYESYQESGERHYDYFMVADVREEHTTQGVLGQKQAERNKHLILIETT
ncbi:MAG: hypothetical protein RR182_00315 [Alistipes sp.]